MAVIDLSTYLSQFVYIISHRFNFNKVAQYKQLTLEEAEEKMNNRKKTQDGYERWMMKSGHNGAAAFGDKDTGVAGVAGGKGRKKMTGDDDEGNFSDKGEEDEEEETARKNRLGLNKKGGDDEDDEGANEDEDLDDDSSEKGKHLSCPYFLFWSLSCSYFHSWSLTRYHV